MITLTLNLDQEQTDAMLAKVAARNAALLDGQQPYTIAAHLQEVLEAEVQATAAQAYEASVARFGAGFRSLPYAERLQIIANLEQSLPG
jgi:hypothetical protein